MQRTKMTPCTVPAAEHDRLADVLSLPLVEEEVSCRGSAETCPPAPCSDDESTQTE